MPHTLDFIFIVLFAILLPAYTMWRQPEMERALKRGAPAARRRVYIETIALQWLFVGILSGLWILMGRSPADLGLTTVTNTAFWVVAALTAIGAGLLGAQVVKVRRDPATRREAAEKIEPLAHLMPRTERERDAFIALSLTAGVCEELLYRGYLIWCFDSLMNTPAAVALSSLLFGLGHAYQGPLSVLKIALLGGVLGVIYMITGSIWLPIAIHAIVDLGSGMTAYEALKPRRDAQEPSAGVSSPPDVREDD